MRRWLWLALAASLMLEACRGRRGPDFSTPEAAWRTLVQALEAQDFNLAADCYAYEEMARRRNPDWPHLPFMERKTIMDRMRQSVRQTLERSPLPPSGTIQVLGQDGEARLAITGGPTLLLVRTPQGWRLLEGWPPNLTF